MVHIIGASGKNIVTFGNLVAEAKRGFIFVTNIRTGTHEQLTVEEMRERNRAIMEAIAGSRLAQKGQAYFKDRSYDAHVRAVNDFEDLCKLAEIQGTFKDDSAARDLERRLPLTLQMS